MLRRIFKWAAALVLVGAGSASAVVPLQMNVQGSLLNNDGNPVNGTFTITFTLYNGQGAGATTVWTETIADVAASGGVFDEVLGGAATPLSAATFTANSQLWLGVKIVAGPGVPNGGQAELPRRPLTSVAYAMESQNAVSAASADNVTCTGCVSLSELGFDVATQAELDTANSQPATSALDLQCTACVATTELNFDVATQAELDSAVSTINSAISGVVGNVATLTTTVGGINTTVGNLSTTVGGLSTTVGGINTTVGNLSTTVGGLSTTVTGHGTDISQLKADVATLKTDVTGLKAEVTLSDLSCTAGQMAVAGANGTWGCQSAPSGGAPTTACQGDQKALQWDGSAWKCVTLDQTGLSTGNAKGYEARDSWGYVWDGVERQSATWLAAHDYCKSKGGRLPTATELWRVSGARSSEIGNSYEANYLWAFTPWNYNGGTQQHAIVRLTDGSITNENDSASRAYRCVWPNNTVGHFTGNHCHGPAGSECWTAVGRNGKMNMDKFDRPTLPQQGAYWECKFYGAHLPTTLDYAENITSGTGLPNGSNEWNWTSDSTRYDLGELVRWVGTQPTVWNGTHSAYASWADRSGAYRFRCIGIGSDIGPTANPTPTDVSFGTKFSGGTTIASNPTMEATRGKTDIVGHSVNLGARTMHAAMSDCFLRGGHLPASRDWFELITDGLPNGAGTATANSCWIADFTRYDIANYLYWTGTDVNYTGYHSQYVTWSGVDTTTFPYRCTWYPLDATYTGPADNLCNAGQIPCFTTSYSATPTAAVKTKVWADKFDRSPQTWINAIKDCADEGGRLASVRDLTELIRNDGSTGLPNGGGPNNYVHTSDAVYAGDAYSMILRWNAVNTGFTLQHSNQITYAIRTSTYNYRCVWSNEIW